MAITTVVLPYNCDIEWIYFRFLQFYWSSEVFPLTIHFRYHYFRIRFITVLACISVSITVIVNGFDLFQLTDISVSVNWNNTG